MHGRFEPARVGIRASAVAPTCVIAAPVAPPAPAVPPGAPPPSPGPARWRPRPPAPGRPVASVQVSAPGRAAGGYLGPAPTVQAVTPPNLDVLAGVNSPHPSSREPPRRRGFACGPMTDETARRAFRPGKFASGSPIARSLTVGNAAGVSLELNGRPVPLLGAGRGHPSSGAAARNSLSIGRLNPPVTPTAPTAGVH